MITYKIINNNIKANCITFINNLDSEKKWQVDIKPFKNKRSSAQNALYWLWLKEIARQRFESGKELLSDTQYHLAFRSLFLGMDEINVFYGYFKEPKSTTKLNTKEFASYLDSIEHYMGSEEGICLPHPSDYSYAMHGEL